MTARFLGQIFFLNLLLIMLPACDRQTRYNVLTTVFTGVPPIEELYGEKVYEEKVKPDDITARKMNYVYKHPLWETRQCSVCHLGGVEQPKNNGEDTALQTTDKQVKLILPVEKLCVKCHRDKTARRAIRDRLWLHNPVARGDCISCHNEHESSNLAHLNEPLGRICDSCHQPEQLPSECSTESDMSQKEATNCLECHNSHMGKDRALLSNDYTEVKIVAETVSTPHSQQLTSPLGK